MRTRDLDFSTNFVNSHLETLSTEMRWTRNSRVLELSNCSDLWCMRKHVNSNSVLRENKVACRILFASRFTSDPVEF
jgi:hypothetical protein